MARDKVFVSRRYLRDAIALLEKRFDVDVWEAEEAPSKAALSQKVAECQGLYIESYDRLDKEVLGHAQALKVISNRAVGTDNIDIPEATTRGILVGNTPGVLHEACADLTFALILSIARRVAFSAQIVKSRQWTELTQLPYMGVDVYGRTLGIVGMGLIGQAVARRARGFDMEIIYFSRTRKPDVERELGLRWVPDLPTLLGESDIVSLHMPLTSETEGLIGRQELRQMKREAFLINTTRGRTVDQNALYEALTDGTIAGAALDVTVPEPLPGDDPLLSLDNVVITPHIASASTGTFTVMQVMAANNIIAGLTGQPMPSCINPEALEVRRRQG